ncbi:MAG: hypothetical protein KJN89_14155 [Gammaproteobacteria bacterium]|nr:hypothetical protein [Gammaproteobacteria bacterium]NNJ51516.1 hypothetical protein [Gammaproteobacteria bacterium]
MPDYDPKSIPILDDIIEDDIVEENKSEPELAAPELDDFEYRAGDDSSIDSLDLLTSDAIDTEGDTAQPELGSIDQLTASAEDDRAEDDTHTIESALIDYHADQEEATIDFHNESQAVKDILHDSDDLSHDDLNEINAEEKEIDPVQPATLSSVVDEVVKQLVPAMEQQLRYLVQQALEEKLPDEILQQLSNEKTD